MIEQCQVFDGERMSQNCPFFFTVIYYMQKKKNEILIIILFVPIYLKKSLSFSLLEK